MLGGRPCSAAGRGDGDVVAVTREGNLAGRLRTFLRTQTLCHPSEGNMTDQPPTQQPPPAMNPVPGHPPYPPYAYPAPFNTYAILALVFGAMVFPRWASTLAVRPRARSPRPANAGLSWPPPVSWLVGSSPPSTEWSSSPGVAWLRSCSAPRQGCNPEVKRFGARPGALPEECPPVGERVDTVVLEALLTSLPLGARRQGKSCSQDPRSRRSAVGVGVHWQVGR